MKQRRLKLVLHFQATFIYEEPGKTIWQFALSLTCLCMVVGESEGFGALSMLRLETCYSKLKMHLLAWLHLQLQGGQSLRPGQHITATVRQLYRNPGSLVN